MSEKNGPNPEDLRRVDGPEPVEWKIPSPGLKRGDGPTLNEKIGSHKWNELPPGSKQGDGPAVIFMSKEEKDELTASRVSRIEPVNKNRTNILKAPHNLNLHDPDDIKLELEQYQKYAPVGAYADEEFAMKFNNGATVYFKNGKVSREKGPAVIFPNWDEVYAVGGKMHRKDGPAYVERSLFDGTRAYYMQDGKLHNLNGPAILEWKHGDDPDKSPPSEETSFVNGAKVSPVLRAYMKAKTDAGKVFGMNIPDLDNDGQEMKLPRM